VGLCLLELMFWSDEKEIEKEHNRLVQQEKI
jgi:hypothetical protein